MMSEDAGTAPHQIRCVECDQPMRWLGSGARWEGDYEFNDCRYECSNACQTLATVSYSTFIPVDVARMRE